MLPRKYALAVALLFTILVWVNYQFFYVHQNSRESAIVARVIDGDTFVLQDGRTVRLANINTPEKGEKGYVEAKNFVRGLENKSVELEVLGSDKYGRVIARVYAPEYLNLELIKLGLAKKFLVQSSEARVFDEAEREAINLGKGIWEKSELFGCVEMGVNAKDEIVEIEVLCNTSALGEVWLSDESRKRFKLGLAGVIRVLVHSANGISNSSDVFLGARQNIWNDDRDTAYLFDNASRIIAFYSYGYTS
ncbi:hypothetical protein D6817_02695 [Candidatus Pacearchaeota archaeon]|nr:MAG: hypothetical protein D6817_02695 [Candidatus Pacearchaeota archaeon]